MIKLEDYGIPLPYATLHFASLQEHIKYVREAGLLTKTPQIQLDIHDESKFSLEEFPAYAMKFHGPKSEETEYNFALAWLHHENLNPHHWGYWIPRSGKYTNKPLAMPENYVREMVADWIGASRAYSGSWDIAEWVNKNVPSFKIHSKTERLIHVVMQELGYGLAIPYTWSYQPANV